MLQTMVKPIINWTLLNSLNASYRHSDWKPKLKVYATKEQLAICLPKGDCSCQLSVVCNCACIRTPHRVHQ